MIKSENTTTNYDAIIIGSGLGGLATASIMAKMLKWRVLVLERHYVIGGHTQTFKRRGGYQFDVGVHYVGGMFPGADERAVSDYLTNGNLDWNRMPEPFDKFCYPDFTFELYADEARFQRELIHKFPTERAAIKRYFKDIKKAENWGIRHYLKDLLPFGLSAIVKAMNKATSALALSTTEAYLDKNFKSPVLKSLLTSQWPAYGQPPSKSAFVIHSAIARHYFRGGYFPKGGSAKIAETIMPIVEQQGGSFKKNHEVVEILVKDGKAYGVKALHKKSGKETPHTFHAPIIVSDVGAHNTYGKLLPKDVTNGELKKLEPLMHARSAVSLYMGLKGSPETLGFKGENHWLFNHIDHEQNYLNPNLLEGKINCGHLSFPSLKSPHDGQHTVEMFTFANYDDFTKWSNEPWMRRGDEYNRLKETISDGMIDLIEKKHPGFRQLVDFKELSTPITFEHFTNHRKGVIYGLDPSPARYREDWINTKTPVENLYMCGADTLCVGIVPAMMSGVAAASHAAGSMGFLKVMGAILKEKSKWKKQALANQAK